MIRDPASYSDEELYKIAGIEPPARDPASYSDEELYKIAGIEPPAPLPDLSPYADDPLPAPHVMEPISNIRPTSTIPTAEDSSLRTAATAATETVKGVADISAGAVEGLGGLASGALAFIPSMAAAGGEALKAVMAKPELLLKQLNIFADTDEKKEAWAELSEMVNWSRAREEQGKVMTAMTYQPKTRFGQTVMRTGASPFEALHAGVGKLTEGLPQEERDKYHLMADAALLAFPKLAKTGKGAYRAVKDGLKRAEPQKAPIPLEEAAPQTGANVYQGMDAKINAQTYHQVIADIKADRWPEAEHSIREAIVKNDFSPNDVNHHLLNPLMGEAAAMTKPQRVKLAEKMNRVREIVRQAHEEKTAPKPSPASGPEPLPKPGTKIPQKIETWEEFTGYKKPPGIKPGEPYEFWFHDMTGERKTAWRVDLTAKEGEYAQAPSKKGVMQMWDAWGGPKPGQKAAGKGAPSGAPKEVEVKPPPPEVEMRGKLEETPKPEPQIDTSPSQLKFIRSRIETAEAGGRNFDPVTGGFMTAYGSTYPSWYTNKKYNRERVLIAVNKAINGKPLTQSQKWLVETLLEDSTREYRGMGRDEIDPMTLKEGQQVIIDGEKYTKRTDPKTADTLLVDGETIRRDAFDMPIEVDEVLPVKEPQPKTARPAKVKPSQPDMVGVPKETMRGKIPARELPETPLERAAGGAKEREAEAALAKRQDSLLKDEEAGASVSADVGGYASPRPSMVELPEMVQLAKELALGRHPAVRKKLRAFHGKALGTFRPTQTSGKIELRADIFRDPDLAARVISHEIGHFVDYLPDKTMARGNILGRIASLKKYMLTMVEKFPESMVKAIKPKERQVMRQEALRDALSFRGKTRKHYLGDKKFRDEINEKAKQLYREKLQREVERRGLTTLNEVMTELKALSQRWKPFDESTATSRFREYRYSSKELYADAFSVLMNDPALLKEMAPKFHEAFFNWLGQKPEVKKLYESTLGKAQSPAIRAERQAVINRMFDRGEEAFRKAEEKPPLNVMQAIKTEVVDVNTALIQKVKEAKRQGRDIPPEKNPMYPVEEGPYAEGMVLQYYRDVESGVLKPLETHDLKLTDLNSYLFYRRVMTERKDIANPKGHTPETAKGQVAEMRETLGAERFEILEMAADKYGEIREKSIIPYLVEADMWSPEAMAKIKDNKNYVTFSMVDYIEGKYGTGVTGQLYQQVGTLGDIASPLTATMLKDAALLRAATVKMAKESTVSFLKDNFPMEIEPAKTQWNGKAHFPVEPGNPAQGIIAYLNKGKVEGYYVDRYIAEMFKRDPYQAKMILRGIEKLTVPLKEIFVCKNPGWMLWNIQRDIRAAALNLPGATLPRILKHAWSSARDAWMDVVRGESTPIVREMYENRMLIIDRVYRSMENAPETTMDRMIMSMSGKPRAYNNMVLRPIIKVWNALDKPGKLSERVMKVAGLRFLKEEATGLHPREIGHLVRSRAGSPDFLRGGMHRRLYNSIWLFSNPALQGWRASYEAFNEGRSTYMWKTFKYNILPKAVMYGTAIGVFGAYAKNLMDKIPDHDKANYICAPLYEDENGKVVYLTFPHDFTGQVIAGLLWKGMNTRKTKDVSEFLDFTSGIFPYSSLNPLLGVSLDLKQYLEGKNPYNEWAGRNVLTRLEHEAGGKDANKAMAKHVWNQFFGTLIKRIPPDTVVEPETFIEKVLDTPGLGGIVRRFVRVSDRGEHEQYRETRLEVRKRRAKELLALKRAINKAVRGDILSLADKKAIVLESARGGNDRARLLIALSKKYGSVITDEYINAGSWEERGRVLMRGVGK